MNGEPTHEIFGYLDSNKRAVMMTDPEPVKLHGDELYDEIGQCVGVCRDYYDEVETQRNCDTCKGTGSVNHAKNRHYEDWKPCHELNCQGGKVSGTTAAEKPGGKKWVMPEHDTTLLVREVRRIKPLTDEQLAHAKSPNFDAEDSAQ